MFELDRRKRRPRRRLIPKFILAAALTAAPFVGRALPGQPAAPSATPVTETLFGVRVTDRWRGMEAMDAATVGWMTAQGDYTRRVLDSIEPRARLLERIAAASSSVAQLWNLQVRGGRTFWLQQSGASASAVLKLREADGKSRTLLDPAAAGRGAAIIYYLASPDGRRVAVGIASNGDEATTLRVYDAATGSLVAGPIDRADFAGISWTEDGAALFLQRLQVTNDPQARFLNVSAQVWDLKTDPRTVVGDGKSVIPTGGIRRPRIVITPSSPVAIAQVRNGVGSKLELWTAPVERASAADAPWRPLATADDEVTAFAVRGRDLYFLSNKGSSTSRVLHLTAGRPFDQADVIVAASPERVIDAIAAASDGLWIYARRGLYSELLFAPASGLVRKAALPVAASISELAADPRRPGAAIVFGNWTTPDTVYATTDAGSPFRNLKLSSSAGYNPSDYTSTELEAVAKDGVHVPLSVISKRGEPAGPRVVRLGGYGAYGQTPTPAFDPRHIPFLDEGAVMAVCHVRGGGEFGEAWHLAGKDAQKPNTWRDLIACGETLVARGITTPDKLVIESESAGGIMVGRAMEEAPRLFAGVIAAAPVANPLRALSMPGGGPNTVEFGSAETQAGFANLYAMDSVQHVQAGVSYPATLIIANLNDPRVKPWQGGKLAAALMDAGNETPVLLRVEREGGHDVGATKAQDDALEADADSFVFWRTGSPRWAPRIHGPSGDPMR